VVEPDLGAIRPGRTPGPAAFAFRRTSAVRSAAAASRGRRDT
jgi:hypothetical protein